MGMVQYMPQLAAVMKSNKNIILLNFSNDANNIFFVLTNILFPEKKHDDNTYIDYCFLFVFGNKRFQDNTLGHLFGFDNFLCILSDWAIKEFYEAKKCITN